MSRAGELRDAAAAIRAHDLGRALAILLDVFGETRAAAITARIDAIGQRAMPAPVPVVAYGERPAIWRMQVDACEPGQLSSLLARRDEARLEDVVHALADRAPDPRIARALLAIACAPKYLPAHDWRALFRGIVRHADDATARELEQIRGGLPDDDRGRAARELAVNVGGRALDAGEVAALAAIDTALSGTPRDAVREAVAADAGAWADALRGVAAGEEAAFAALEAGWQDALPATLGSLLRLVQRDPQPQRARIVRVVARAIADRDFFSPRYDLDASPLAKQIWSGWPVYLALLRDRDPQVRIAAAHLVAFAFVPVSASSLVALLEATADDVAQPPHVRATFLLAAVRLRGHDGHDRPRQWPVDDRDPLVAIAGAIGEARANRSKISRESLAILEQAGARPREDPAWFPWAGGEVAAVARATLAWLALRPLDTTLDALEQAIRDGARTVQGTSALWLAEDLLPRVFGHERPRRDALSHAQRRLAGILAILRSPALETLGLEISTAHARAELRLTGRALRVGPSIDYHDWTRELDETLARGHADASEVPEIEIVRRGRVVGLRLVGSMAMHPRLLAGTGVIALCGGAPLVEWLGARERCDTLRVLALRDHAGELANVVDAPALEHVRRLVLSWTSDGATLLGSPRLRDLEALIWEHACSELAPLTRLERLRELRVDARGVADARRPAVDAVAAVFAALRAPLRVLELHALDVPIDTLAGNDALVLEELALRGCTVRGGELLGALRLTAFDAQRASLDDAAVVGLARSTTLVRVDLSGTNIGDAAARALAAMPSPLASLDLRDTNVRDLAIVEALATRPGMRELGLPHRVLVELALAGRGFPAVAVPPIGELAPQPPPGERAGPLAGTSVEEVVRAAAACGQWPDPPAGLARRFVLDQQWSCGYCNGSGWGPEGHCPMHATPTRVFHDGSLPSDADHVREVARRANSMRGAEQHAAELAALLAARGIASPRTIVWHLAPPAARPASLVDELARGVAYADTPLWPYACLRVASLADRAVFERATEIVELGYAIHAIDRDAIHLVLGCVPASVQH